MNTTFYQDITATILDMIRAKRTGTGLNWSKEISLGIPYNLKTHDEYHGINVLLLWNAAVSKGYSSNAWLTYKQAAELGGQVRKGERSQQGIFFKVNTVIDKHTEEERKIPLLSKFSVFNLDQIDGIDSPTAEISIKPEWAQIDSAEQLLKDSQARIIETGAKAFYRPSTDEIYLPERSRFADGMDFYSVAMHELVHWTGAKSRLNRDFSSRFGMQGYAFEELIAELGSAFLAAQIGFVSRQIPNHAHYIDNWLTALNDDPKMVIHAASQAEKAHQYIMNLTNHTKLAA